MSCNAWAIQEQASLTALLAIDPKQLPATLVAPYASLLEQLQSDLQLRVCRSELWTSMTFLAGNGLSLSWAEQQPVTMTLRTDLSLPQDRDPTG